MKVGIIGAGRVGCAFAFALSGRGVELTGIYSKSPESAAFVAEKLNKPVQSDLKRLVADAGTVILAVPDSRIASAAEHICGLCSPEDIRGRVFLHCSGALSSSVLKPLENTGGFTGSLHPIQTFADREDGWKSMFHIYFGFEGGCEASKSASDIVRLLDGSLLAISAEAKPLYHAAACILSNYMVILSYAAGSLLETAGIAPDTGMKAFLPLLQNTVANIAAMGSVNALTGPISRGDAGIVTGHLEAISGKSAEIAELYRVLGKAAVQVALVKGTIGTDEAQVLLDILKQEGKSP